MQTAAEIQEEIDKQSISLIGQKEQDLLISNPPTDITSTEVVSLDSKCLNCQNNANGLDRAIIFQLFKVACLRYKPKPISFKDRVIPRMELLKNKQVLLDQMEVE